MCTSFAKVCAAVMEIPGIGDRIPGGYFLTGSRQSTEPVEPEPSSHSADTALGYAPQTRLSVVKSARVLFSTIPAILYVALDEVQSTTLTFLTCWTSALSSLLAFRQLPTLALAGSLLMPSMIEVPETRRKPAQTSRSRRSAPATIPMIFLVPLFFGATGGPPYGWPL